MGKKIIREGGKGRRSGKRRRNECNSVFVMLVVGQSVAWTRDVWTKYSDNIS